MGAMLLARSATASTGWRNASSGPQPGPLILGLVPDQPAPGAVTDRIHKAIYCRRQAAELSQPGCLTEPGSPGQPTRAGRCRRRCRQRRVNPRLRQTSSGARRQSGRRATWLRHVLRGGVRRDADALGQRTHMCAEMSISSTRISMHEPAYLHAGAWSSVPELYADLPFMYLFELVADDLCGTVTSLRRRRRWRALPCWDPRGGLAWAPRAACMSGSGGRSHGCGPPCGRVRQGWRRLGCYQPAGWWRCGLAPSRRGVRWPGRRGSWAVSVVRTTALDPNRGMSVAAGGRVRPVGDHGQAFERR